MRDSRENSNYVRKSKNKYCNTQYLLIYLSPEKVAKSENKNLFLKELEKLMRHRTINVF